MTRQEQIDDAAQCAFKIEHPISEVSGFFFDALTHAFKDGAAWADAHPQGWISVEDELPPQYGTYLIATEGNVVETSLYDIDGWDNWRGGKITHWQPLPQPPKKGGER